MSRPRGMRRGQGHGGTFAAGFDAAEGLHEPMRPVGRASEGRVDFWTGPRDDGLRKPNPWTEVSGNDTTGGREWAGHAGLEASADAACACSVHLQFRRYEHERHDQ